METVIPLAALQPIYSVAVVQDADASRSYLFDTKCS